MANKTLKSFLQILLGKPYEMKVSCTVLLERFY